MISLTRVQNCCGLAALALVMLTVAPLPAQTLLALVDTGELYASNDGGLNWTATATLPVSDAAGLIAGASPSELFLASGTGTIYRSVNGGTDWTAVGTVSSSDVVDLAGRPDGGLLVLTATGTVWHSTDSGATFNALGTLTASNHVSLAKGGDANLYALTATGEVARSTNDGADWNVVGTIPVSDAVSIRRIDLDLFVLTDSGFTYKSTDDGATWSAVGTVSQVGMSGLVQYTGELVAVNKTGLVARSADGSAWSWVGAINQLNVIALANDVPQTIGVPDSPVGPALVLASPYPNPLAAGGAVQLNFNLPAGDRVRVSLYDANGRRVGPLLERVYADAGDYELSYTPGNLPAGVYFLELRTAGGLKTSRSLHVLR